MEVIAVLLNIYCFANKLSLFYLMLAGSKYKLCIIKKIIPITGEKTGRRISE